MKHLQSAPSITTLVGLLLLCSTAAASSIMVTTPVELAGRADKIVYGKVESVRSLFLKNRIISEARIRVIEPLKGAQADEIITVSYPGGRVGKLAATTVGAPTFKKTERVVLYLESRRGRTVVMGQNFGVYKVNKTERTGRHIATRDITQLGLMSAPGSKIDVNSIPRVLQVPLSTLLDDIRAHVKAAQRRAHP